MPTDHSCGSRYPLANYESCESFPLTHVEFLDTISSEKEPRSYLEAIKDTKWFIAMHDEINALEKNRTWAIAYLLPSKKAIGCKWVYKIKYKSDGPIERYKAHLFAQGDTQVEGLDLVFMRS